MNTVAGKMGKKVANVQGFTITKKKLHQTVKQRKNSSAPGINGIQFFFFFWGGGGEVYGVQYKYV